MCTNFYAGSASEKQAKDQPDHEKNEQGRYKGQSQRQSEQAQDKAQHRSNRSQDNVHQATPRRPMLSSQCASNGSMRRSGVVGVLLALMVCSVRVGIGPVFKYREQVCTNKGLVVPGPAVAMDNTQFMNEQPWLSIVMPVLNEAQGLDASLQALQTWRQCGAELIVVDGGSDDHSLALAAQWADRTVCSPRGRACQMNAGAATARGDWLLFLHADTQMPAAAIERLRAVAVGAALWGRFDVRIDSTDPLLLLVGFMMNLRSRLSGVATGDQAVFVRRQTFEQVGNFPDVALMEDIALSRRLKALQRPVCLRPPVVTSARRWLRHGIWPTIWLMWRLRAAYFLGADPDELAVRYGYRPRKR